MTSRGKFLGRFGIEVPEHRHGDRCHGLSSDEIDGPGHCLIVAAGGRRQIGRLIVDGEVRGGWPRQKHLEDRQLLTGVTLGNHRVRNEDGEVRADTIIVPDDAGGSQHRQAVFKHGAFRIEQLDDNGLVGLVEGVTVGVDENIDAGFARSERYRTVVVDVGGGVADVVFVGGSIEQRAVVNRDGVGRGLRQGHREPQVVEEVLVGC